MPEYPFNDVETGESVTIFMPMADAVSIGDEITHKGRRLVRVMSDAVLGSRGFKPHLSLQLPLNDKLAPRCNEHGEVVFHNQKEINEYVDRNNDTPGRGKLTWDE